MSSPLGRSKELQAFHTVISEVSNKISSTTINNGHTITHPSNISTDKPMNIAKLLFKSFEKLSGDEQKQFKSELKTNLKIIRDDTSGKFCKSEQRYASVQLITNKVFLNLIITLNRSQNREPVRSDSKADTTAPQGGTATIKPLPKKPQAPESKPFRTLSPDQKFYKDLGVNIVLLDKIRNSNAPAEDKIKRLENLQRSLEDHMQPQKEGFSPEKIQKLLEVYGKVENAIHDIKENENRKILDPIIAKTDEWMADLQKITGSNESPHKIIKNLADKIASIEKQINEIKDISSDEQIFLKGVLCEFDNAIAAAKAGNEHKAEQCKRVLEGLLDKTATVSINRNEIEIKLNENETVKLSEIQSGLKYIKLDKKEEDYEILFTEKYMNEKKDLIIGIIGEDAEKINITKSELFALQAYTAQLYHGANPLLRGDIGGVDTTKNWAGAFGLENNNPEALGPLIANIILASSALNKSPNFTSNQNVSQSNPEGYLIRGMSHVSQEVVDRLNNNCTNNTPFTEKSFMSASWLGTETFRPTRSKNTYGVEFKILSKTGKKVMQYSDADNVTTMSSSKAEEKNKILEKENEELRKKNRNIFTKKSEIKENKDKIKLNEAEINSNKKQINYDASLIEREILFSPGTVFNVKADPNNGKDGSKVYTYILEEVEHPTSDT